jgi:hypothetical protein
VLGPRRAEVTHWRCRRIDEDGGKGSTLFWNDGGLVETNEWPIKTFTPQVLLDRWGPGRYVVQYICDDEGVRKPLGRSRVVSVTLPTSAAPSPAPEGKAPSAPGLSSVLPALQTGDGNLSTVFSLLAYLEDRNERTRTDAAAEARYAIERAMAETKAAQERSAQEIKAAQEKYRADLEFQLERERLASKERIAQIEAQGRVPATRGEKIDQEALALRIRDLVDESVRDALDERGDDVDEAAPPAAMDQGTALVTAFKEMLAPILPIVIAKLGMPITPEPLPAPTPEGRGGNDNGGGNPPKGGFN